MRYDYSFVTPLKEEAALLIKKLANKKTFSYGKREVIVGTLRRKMISVIISGSGKIKSASATQLIIDQFPAHLYIHYGTAGALTTSLSIGDTVVATEIVEHDVRELFPKVIPPPIHYPTVEAINNLRKHLPTGFVYGRILSGDEDVIKSSRRNFLFRTYRGLSVDWESAGFSLTCNLNNKSHIVLRVISDLAYENTSTEYRSNQQTVISKLTTTLIRLITRCSSTSEITFAHFLLR